MKFLHLGLALCLLTFASQTAAQTCPAGNPRIAPNSRYIVSEPVAAQQVVQDQRTGLTWKRCLQGFTGANCATGTEVFNSWTVALSIADDEVFAGHSDWRLPTINELRSLVETGCHDPAINTAIFTNLNSPRVWSSTTYVSNLPTAWGVTFTQGESVVIGKSGGGSIRLVRGGPPLSSFNSGLDFTPNGYSFTAQSAVPVSSLRVSNAISVSAITTVTGIGISGAAGSQYRINGGAWTSTPGEVGNGDNVEVRHTSAASLATATTTTLGIGGISANFVTTTLSGGCPGTVVTNGNDSGSGSLRDIIAAACPASIVTFQAGVTSVTLTTAELLINKDLTVDGGANGVTVTRSAAGGTPQFRIFHVTSGSTVNMSGLTVSNGDHPNQAGGIQNSGNLTLNNMQISGNRSLQGGGIQNDSVLTLSNSSIVNNLVTSNGGGLAIFGTDTTLSNCTISGNGGGVNSGGIFAGGVLSITNCSIVENQSTNSGGGITVNSASVTLRNSIVARNTIASLGFPSNITGALLAESSFNVIALGGIGGLVNGVNNNQVGVAVADLPFGPLGNYGGLTPTRPLLPGNVAINAGTSAGAPAVDQRGIARPEQGLVDVGAYESRGFNLSVAGGNNQTAPVSTAFAAPLSVNVTAISAGEPVQGGIVRFTSLGLGASASLASNPATIVGGTASVNATANAQVGSYTVSSNTAGSTGGANFALSNSGTVGGTVTGLVGTGLVLRNNSGDDLTINANGVFTFSTAVNSGASYAVTVFTQPGAPAQTCSVSNGSGTVAAASITNVQVSCAAASFTVGGMVSGLVGAGLVLRNNGGNDLAISINGGFTFTTPIDSGSAYAVTVFTQPGSPSQTCTVSNGSGTVGAANITNVAVNCVTSTFTVGGTVTGLAGAGLVLRNNGGDDLTIAANGAFTFTTPVASGSAYAATVFTQPSNPTQTCTVSNGSGTVGAANVNNVAVNCATSTFTIGGTVTGLAGTGLVLRNNGGDDLTIGANGAFTFTTSVASGSAYAATVFAQPSNPTQTCTVSEGSGTVGAANITNVAVNCATSTFTIGGTVTGLAGTGLVLRNNGGDDLTIAANGAFTFTTPVASGSAYAVTVFAQPSNPTQTCTVSEGSGTVGAANITSVAVNCSTSTFTIGGTVTGLAGTGLVLRNNGGDDLTIAANGAFTFTTPVASGSAYDATAFTQPSNPTQTCTVSEGSGTVVAANISNVAVSCQTLTLGLSVAAIDFGVRVIQTGQTNEITVSNTGTGPVTLSAISGPGAPFTINGGTCTALPLTLGLGQSCTLLVRFLPTTAGTFDAQIAITSTASASPTLVQLRGVGVNPVAVPTAGPLGLLLLGLLLGLLGWVALRQRAG